MSCAVAAPHALSTLAVMTPGSMPAESKAFSSLARQGTTEDFALQLSASAVTGHLRLVMNVRFLTQDGPDREDGYSKEYRSGSEPEDEQSSLLM